MGIYSDILLTADYDHTVTGPDGVIPQRNLDAIRFFIDNGGTFTLNTGRSVPMIQSFKDILPVNAPLLLYNGSAAYDLQKKKMLFCHTIRLDMQQTLEECIAAFPDLTVELQAEDAHYCFSENPAFGTFSVNNHCAWGVAKTDDDLGPFMKFTLYGTFHEPTLHGLYTGSEEELRRMDEVEQLLRDKYGEYCEVFRAAKRIIDVHAKGVSKGLSARMLKGRLNKNILVCIGDGENDITMLNEADYAFTPSDGVISGRFPTVCACGDGAVADLIYNELPRIVKNKA